MSIFMTDAISRSIITTKEIQLTEERIDHCFTAMGRCAEGTWAFEFWQRTAMTLLRQLNRKMNEYK